MVSSPTLIEGLDRLADSDNERVVVGTELRPGTGRGGGDGSAGLRPRANVGREVGPEVVGLVGGDPDIAAPHRSQQPLRARPDEEIAAERLRVDRELTDGLSRVYQDGDALFVGDVDSVPDGHDTPVRRGHVANQQEFRFLSHRAVEGLDEGRVAVVDLDDLDGDSALLFQPARGVRRADVFQRSGDELVALTPIEAAEHTVHGAGRVGADAKLVGVDVKEVGQVPSRGLLLLHDELPRLRARRAMQGLVLHRVPDGLQRR